MTSLASKILSREIRLVRPVIKSFNVKTSRAFQDKLAQLGSKAVAGRVHYADFNIGTIPAVIAAPENAVSDTSQVLLYLHGGGYVTGGIVYAKGVAGFIAAETSCNVVAIAYRLAPENPFPAALEDAFCAYTWLLEYYRPENISFIGESAGGGLMLALCHKLKQEGINLPARLVPISPWTDLTLQGKSYTANRKLDPSLTFKEIKGFVDAYAPNERKNPLVSPLFGDFSGFPPCRVYVGSDELLRDDSLKLYDKLISAGSECSIVVGEGMWHAYVLFPTPESFEALAEIKAFLSCGIGGDALRGKDGQKDA